MITLWAVLFPSSTVISMRLPDLTSVFVAETWDIIKPLEEIKNALSSTCIFTDSFVSPRFTIQEAGISLIGMMIKKVTF